MAVDFSPWDASKAWHNGTVSDNPAAFYNGICAGKKAGDPATQAAHALPYKYHPGDGPNAAGVRNCLARFDQTEGLTNATEAKATLEKALKEVQAAEAENKKSAPTVAQIRAARQAAYMPARGARGKADLPGGSARLHAFPGQLRARLVNRNGRDFYEVDGYATVFNRPYQMYDMFGEYEETADSGMLDKSLAMKPDVAFLVNHRGVTMARTTNGTLDLEKDSTGLAIHGYLNADRQDVRDLASAIRDGLVDEMSFAFMLNAGEWNDDFTQFRITEADINRGDVSAVNYGANPYTSISARSAEWLSMVDLVPASVARAGISRLSQRTDFGSLGADFSKWEVESIKIHLEPPDEEAEETGDESGTPAAKSSKTPVETRAAGNPESDDAARFRAALLAFDDDE